MIKHVKHFFCFVLFCQTFFIHFPLIYVLLSLCSNKLPELFVYLLLSPKSSSYVLDKKILLDTYEKHIYTYIHMIYIHHTHIFVFDALSVKYPAMHCEK